MKYFLFASILFFSLTLNSQAEVIQQFTSTGLVDNVSISGNGDRGSINGQSIDITENGTLNGLRVSGNFGDSNEFRFYAYVADFTNNTYCFSNGFTDVPKGQNTGSGLQIVDFRFNEEDGEIANGCSLLAARDYAFIIGAYGINGGDQATTTLYYSNQDPYSGGDCTGTDTAAAGTCSSSNDDLYFAVYTDTDVLPDDTGTTRILDMQPENGTTTSSSVYFSLRAYIAQEDAERGVGVKVFLHNIDQNVLLLSAFSPSDIVLYDDHVDSSGVFEFSTTTILADGNYRLYASLKGTSGSLFGQPALVGCSLVGSFLTLACQNASTQFIVNQATFIGNISQTSFSQINSLFSSTSATSTANLANTCNPISSNIATAFLNTSFSVTNCLAFLFIPDSGQLFDVIQNFRENAGTRFPLGYVTDFLSIISTTTETTLTVIDATIPSVLPGGGAHIRLDLNGILDSTLNATSGVYYDATTTDETLYETTIYYWRIVVYILSGFYIIRRILGSHVIHAP